MEYQEKTRRTTHVTKGLSHRDSRARRPADESSAPFDLHSCVIRSISLRGKALEAAVCHVTLNAWCAHPGTPYGSRASRTLVRTAEQALQFLEDAEPGVSHGLLIHGVRYYPGGPVSAPSSNTFRQYAARIGATAMILDACPLGGERVLLLQAERWRSVPKVLWHAMAAEIMFADAPGTRVVQSEPPPCLYS